MKPEIHNPDNLTPKQYEANKGYRLLYAEEMDGPLPEDAEFWQIMARRWARSNDRAARPAHGAESSVTYRTRTPYVKDCVCTPSTQAADGWIELATRRPTEADFPMIYGAYNSSGAWTQLYCGELFTPAQTWTHWLPCNKVPPPPQHRKKTRHEQDTDWLDEVFRDHGSDCKFDMWAVRSRCLSAIDHERAEIAKLILRYEDEDSPTELCRRIYDRVKGSA